MNSSGSSTSASDLDEAISWIAAREWVNRHVDLFGWEFMIAEELVDVLYLDRVVYVANVDASSFLRSFSGLLLFLVCLSPDHVIFALEPTHVANMMEAASMCDDDGTIMIAGMLMLQDIIRPMFVVEFYSRCFPAGGVFVKLQATGWNAQPILCFRRIQISFTTSSPPAQSRTCTSHSFSL